MNDIEASAGRYAIGSIVAHYQVSRGTLLFYEEQGLLRPERCGEARFFSEKDLVRLEIVLKAQRLGFSLPQVSQLIESRERTSVGAADRAPGSNTDQLAERLATLIREHERISTAIEDTRRALSSLPSSESRSG